MAERKLAPCGTLSAYKRHRRWNEDACAECKAALARYQRDINKRWTEENREKNLFVKREYAKRNYARLASARKLENLKRYGLTVETRDALLAEQGNRCGICSTDDPRGKDWHVDHDHARGLKFVRGILCDRCNRVLGMMGDTLESVRALGWIPGIAYLERAEQRFLARSESMNTTTTRAQTQYLGRADGSP